MSPFRRNRMHLAPSPRRIDGFAGFTLVEMMAVLAVMAILATLAVPSLQARIVRGQIVEAVRLADIAKAPVAAAWAASSALPADNAAAGLPPPSRVVSNLVSALQVENGAIHLTFGNQANAAIRGKVLSLRPGVVSGAEVVPVAWVCGNAEPPVNMLAQGTNRTDVRGDYLPLNCQAATAK